MKKRIAYVGLSYPIRFDNSKKIKSWLSPRSTIEVFPIIDAPWGLMLLYDELWFLCPDVCPVNMRECKFVKYVTELYPNINYMEIYNTALMMQEKPQCTLLSASRFYKSYVSTTNYNSYISTTATEYCRLGNVLLKAGTLPENYLFDVLLKNELERLSSKKIELIANSNVQFEDYITREKEFDLTSKLILNGIPNYMTRYGPYHPVIDEMRDNEYLVDYRRWILNQHSHLQEAEICEIKEAVEKSLQEIQQKLMLKYFDEHSKSIYFTTTAKTIVCTAIGAVSIPFSIGVAAKDIYDNGRAMKEIESDRWAGFVVEARNAIRKISKNELN